MIRFVSSVLENFRRENWRRLFWPVLFFIFIFTASATYSYLDWIDFFEPVVPEVLSEQLPEDPLANVEKCPSLVEEDNRKVVLLDSNCGVVRRFNVEDLKVADVFDLTEEKILESWFMLHSGHSVIQEPEDSFYFLVSNTYFCGMQNCTYALYRYNAESDTLDIINNDIFGMIVELYLSPGREKMAIVSTAHAMVCDNRSYLDLLDIASKKKQRVDKFVDPELEVTSIDELRWLSERTIELLTTHGAGCNPKVGTVRHKRFLYDLETGEVELELLEERDVSHG